MKQERKRKLINSTFLFSLLACLALFAGAQSALAQTTGSATLRGTVKDPKGAVIAGANVTLINEATKEERKATTNNEGVYVFPTLTPARYTLRVEVSGFKTLEQAVNVETSTNQGLDVSMEVGQATEKVEITAQAENLIHTETGAQENTITAKQIENLSIVSRSALELLRVLPGVVAPDETALESISFGGGANQNSAYHVNGLRGEQNNVTIDGSRMMDIGSNNGTIITANPDMVQEVKVQTSNYAAEHGTSAVQISATTKSGSAQFHGSLYDYNRNYRFQANDRSNSIGGSIGQQPIARPHSKYNYPGGNIGGPVLLPFTKFNRNRDKLFFFAGLELYRQQVDEGSHLATVPSLKMRQGDFSELLASGQRVTVPAGCTVNGVTAGNPAPNNNISACADPLGRALLNLYPAPNYNAVGGSAFNYVYSVLRPNNRNQFTSRFDYNISDKTKLYVRLAREYEEQGFPRGLWWDSSTYELPGKLQSKNLGRSAVVNLTNIISPTMTNEVLFSASKLKLNYDYGDPSKVSYAGLGVQPANFKGFQSANPYVPVSIIDNWSSELFTAYGFPIHAWNDSFAVTDNLVKVRSTHTLKFGGFIEQANKDQQSNHDTDIVLAQWGQPNGTGNNYGDLFVGRPIEITESTDRPRDNFRLYNYEFYGQDSWKVRPNITLEYGMRFAWFPQNFERKGLGVLFDPSKYNPSQGIFINGDKTRPNGFLLASRGEIPKGVLPNPPVQWMPRLNLAWDIGGKGDLVFRAGAGLFYNRVQGNYDYYSSGQMPNMYGATVDTPWQGSNGLSFGDLKNVDPFSSIANVNVSSRDVNSNRIPRVANMSATIEKRLPFNNILAVAYVGTQGRHLPQQRNINIIPVGRLLSGTVNGVDLSVPANRAAVATNASLLRQFRPFQAYNTVGVYQFTGTSTYHSLQATLNHQGKNLQYFATYTFGKALGTVATNESDGSAWADPIDTRGRSWGILPFDRTHVFNLSYNWMMPNLAPKGFDNVVTRGVLNGWQMSGITTFQSGIPIRLRFNGDISGASAAVAWYGTDAFNVQGQSTGAITPIYLSNPLVGGTKLGSKMLDISALQVPSFGHSGPSQPPFYIRTPSRSNFDVSFFKNFKITESKRVQFRSGFFNIFNQAYPTQIDITNPNNSDINLTLNTYSLDRRDSQGHISETGSCSTAAPAGAGANGNICDPAKGYAFTQSTLDNFGRITNKHGRRIVEFALKFEF